MDYNQLSDSDLIALVNKDFNSLSDSALLMLTKEPEKETIGDSELLSKYGAFGYGTLEKLAGAGQALGLVDSETYKQIKGEADILGKDREISRGLGQMLPVLTGAALGGGLTGAATAGSALMGTAGASLGGGAVDALSEQSRLLSEGVDPTTADISALTSGGLTGLGIALPGGVGAGLAKKALTGVGANVGLGMAERGIQNEILSDYDKLQRDILDPTAMAFDAAFGGLAGGMAHLVTPRTFKGEDPNLTKEVTPEELKVRVEETNKNALEGISRSIFEDEERLHNTKSAREYIKRDLEEMEYQINRATPEERQRLADEIPKQQEKLANIDNVINQTEAKIKEQDSVYATRAQEIGVEPRNAVQRAQEYLDTQAIPSQDPIAIKRAEIALNSAKRRADEAIQTKAQDVQGLQESIMGKQEVPEQVTPTTQPKQPDLFNDELPKQEGTVQLIDAATPEQRVVENITAQPKEEFDFAEPQSQVTIHNATPKETKLVNDILTKLGLHNEKIDIDLSSNKSNVQYTDIGYNVSIHGETIRPEIATAKGIKFWTSLKPDEAIKFEKAWTIAHELGHVALNRLLRNKAFDNTLINLHSDYIKWVQKNPIIAQELGGITPNKIEYANQVSPDYYTRFPEFFAQRVAREMSKSTDTPIGRFVQDIKTIWKEIVKEYSLGIRSLPLVDDFINSIIKQDYDSLVRFGTDMHEVMSVNETRTPIEAKKLQDRLFLTKGDDYAEPLPSAVRTTIDNIEQVMSNVTRQADINPQSSDLSKFSTVISNNVIPLLQKSGLIDNPAVKYMVNVIYNATERTHYLRNKILSGDSARITPHGIFTSLKRVADETSFSVLASKATNKDFYEVHKVFLKGQNLLDYEPNLKLNGTHLTPKQQALYKATAKVYENSLNEMNSFLESHGKKVSIQKKLGYIAPVRRGDHVVAIKHGTGYVRGVTDEGFDTSNTIYFQRFFTEKEANEFISKFNSLKQKGYTANIEKNLPSIDNPFQADVLSAIRESAIEGGASANVISRIDSVINEMIGKGGTIGSHHKRQMGFIEGGFGTELLFNQEQLGYRFRDSIFNYVNETTKQMEKVDISTKSDLLLNHPEMDSRGNLKQFVQEMRDYALNTDKESILAARGIKELFDEYYTNLMHKIGRKDYHPTAHAIDAGVGKATHAFYISVLMSRPSFIIAQATAFTVGLRSLVRNQGFIGATHDMADGFNRLMKNDKELFDYINWVVDNRSTFHPQFINDLNKFGLFDKATERTQKLLGYISGETPATAADSLSRLLTSSYMFAHYKKQGFTGEKLYRLTSRTTDENMIQYGMEYKAPIYKKMGVVGDLVSPLATFSHAQMMNLASDIKFFINNPKKFQGSLPMMSTFITTMIMGGAIGAVGFAELEFVLQAFNYLLRKTNTDYQIPTLWDMFLGSPSKALFGEENKYVDRTISHGLLSSSTYAISEEGFDIGSSNRWRPLIADVINGDKNWAETIPVITWSLDVAGAVKDIVSNNKMTEGERREALRKIVPGMWFGIVDALKFDSFGEGLVPQAKNSPDFRKTPDKAIAKILGTRTIDEATQKEKWRQDKVLKEKLNQEVRKVVNHITLNKVSPDELEKQTLRLAKEYNKSVDEIFSMMEKTWFDAKTAREDFPSGQKSMALESSQSYDIRTRYIGEEE